MWAEPFGIWNHWGPEHAGSLIMDPREWGVLLDP